jgi:xylan 1,4-beta-xylosidase
MAGTTLNQIHPTYRFALGLCYLIACWFTSKARAEETFLVSIRVDASATRGELKPIWRFFGGDEPNYATMKHGRKLIGELGELAPEDVYFRTHNLLCTGDGTPALKWGSTNAYREDDAGNPIYNWTILDRIFDTYLERGVRPYVQIGFMPQAMSTRPEPYQHDWKPGDDYNRIFTGWAYPPKDYEKWGELAYQWARHCVEKYGKEEVATWYWETWNEADIGYWRGQPRDESFHKLHDYAIAGVRRALPNAKVGGPDAAYDGNFIRNFLEHCLHGTNYATGEKGTPLDFIAFHAKGGPNVVDGHVRMGIAQQLRAIGNSMRIVASFPELKNTPIVIGESDPDGCAACGAQLYPQNAYRNGALYASYTAASFARKHDLADRHGVNLEGALTWAFEFEGQPYFAGYRTLATNGIDKPVLNVFRMFSRMRGERLDVESDHAVSLDSILRHGVREKPDVAALACRNDRTLCVMLWHYHDDDVPGPAAEVELNLHGLPEDFRATRVRHFRIDDEHSNAYTVWKKMGSPQEPTPEQYDALEQAGQLAEIAPVEAQLDKDAATLSITLPRQSVSLLVMEQPNSVSSDASAASDQSAARRVESVPQAVREKFDLAPFYQKFLDAGGLPILSSAKVSDAALLEAAHLIDQMLAAREDVRQEMVGRRVRIVVMAPTEMTTDVPEQSHMDSEYWDRRARGLGGRICSCGEENLLNLPDDRYSNENILIHEFAHTIHNYGLRRLDPEFNRRLKDIYDRSLEKGLWKDTYAATNAEEFWAEGVQSYFDCNAPHRRRVHNEVNTREELKEYDPELFALIDESFKGPEWRYARYDKRQGGTILRADARERTSTSNAQ